MIKFKNFKEVTAFRDGPRPKDKDDLKLWKILRHSKNYSVGPKRLGELLHKLHEEKFGPNPQLRMYAECTKLFQHSKTKLDKTP